MADFKSTASEGADAGVAGVTSFGTVASVAANTMIIGFNTDTEQGPLFDLIEKAYRTMFFDLFSTGTLTGERLVGVTPVAEIRTTLSSQTSVGANAVSLIYDAASDKTSLFAAFEQAKAAILDYYAGP